MLTEVSRVYPNVGPRAAALVSQAPVSQLTPGLVSALTECDWATDILLQWERDEKTPKSVKRAIENAGKQ
jgi:hypothetical protein